MQAGFQIVLARTAASFAKQAGAVRADVLLTPELSESGYGPHPEVFADQALDERPLVW